MLPPAIFCHFASNDAIISYIWRRSKGGKINIEQWRSDTQRVGASPYMWLGFCEMTTVFDALAIHCSEHGDKVDEECEMTRGPQKSSCCGKHGGGVMEESAHRAEFIYEMNDHLWI